MPQGSSWYVGPNAGQVVIISPMTNTCDRMENVGNGFMAGGAVAFGAGSLADAGIITAPVGAGLQGAGIVMAAGGGLAYLGGMVCNELFH